MVQRFEIYIMQICKDVCFSYMYNDLRKVVGVVPS